MRSWRQATDALSFQFDCQGLLRSEAGFKHRAGSLRTIKDIGGGAKAKP